MDNSRMYPPSCEPPRVQRGILVFLHQAVSLGMVPSITIPFSVLRQPDRGDPRLVDKLAYALLAHVTL
jgi:hypothetical protein